MRIFVFVLGWHRYASRQNCASLSLIFNHLLTTFSVKRKKGITWVYQRSVNVFNWFEMIRHKPPSPMFSIILHQKCKRIGNKTAPRLRCKWKPDVVSVRERKCKLAVSRHIQIHCITYTYLMLDVNDEQDNSRRFSCTINTIRRAAMSRVILFLFILSLSSPLLFLSHNHSFIHPSIQSFNCHLHLTANCAETHFAYYVKWHTKPFLCRVCVTDTLTHTCAICTHFYYLSGRQKNGKTNVQSSHNCVCKYWTARSVCQFYLFGQKTKRKRKTKILKIKSLKNSHAQRMREKRGIYGERKRKRKNKTLGCKSGLAYNIEDSKLEHGNVAHADKVIDLCPFWPLFFCIIA